MSEEPTREDLLAEYAKQPLREYLQIDVFMDSDLPADLRPGEDIAPGASIHQIAEKRSSRQLKSLRTIRRAEATRFRPFRVTSLP
jgi:hypothetical protein